MNVWYHFSYFEVNLENSYENRIGISKYFAYVTPLLKFMFLSSTLFVQIELL